MQMQEFLVSKQICPILLNKLKNDVKIFISLGYHTLGGLKDRNLFSHSCGCWEVQDQSAS